MPIPPQRDLEKTREQLATWFTTRLGAAAEVSVPRGPGATGFSNETHIVDVTWGDQRQTFVVRVAPTGYSLFPDADFSRQVDVLRALGAHTSVPVPQLLFEESDPDVLGAPFYVMAEVVGVVPPDNPPYHVAGWLHDVSEEQRAQVWWAAIDTIAEVHSVDWRALDLPWLGPTLQGQLDYYTSWLSSIEQSEPVPVARRALAWLLAHLPADEEVVLSWGDARIGNIMYSDSGERLAVLDWEMTSLGAPEMDLAWTLFVDRHHHECMAVPRLAGFPSAAETVARYEAARGVRLRHMDFYEVFAGFRFSVIMARLALIFKDWELLQPDDAMAQDNTVSRLTETVLAERGA